MSWINLHYHLAVFLFDPCLCQKALGRGVHQIFSRCQEQKLHSANTCITMLSQHLKISELNINSVKYVQYILNSDHICPEIRNCT